MNESLQNAPFVHIIHCLWIEFEINMNIFRWDESPSFWLEACWRQCKRSNELAGKAYIWSRRLFIIYLFTFCDRRFIPHVRRTGTHSDTPDTMLNACHVPSGISFTIKSQWYQLMRNAFKESVCKIHVLIRFHIVLLMKKVMNERDFVWYPNWN